MSQTRSTTQNGDMGDSMKGTADRLATMAQETIDEVATTASRTADQVRGAATKAVDKAVDTAKQAQQTAVAVADENLRKVRSYVERNPLTAVGMAVAAGALLISLIRR